MFQLNKKINVVATVLFALSSVIATGVMAIEKQACDVAADIALKAENYPAAIDLHRKFLQSEEDSAIAHYHLGFAYGMIGRVSDEISEYRSAIALGFNTWDLFLNLGLAYYDQHDLMGATTALERAVSLGPQYADTHFNLAVVYERENRLTEALREIIAALILAPENLDAANTDAVICAKMGDLASARNIWKQLLQAAPDYAPARTNLAVLGRWCRGSCSPSNATGSVLVSHVRSEETATFMH